MALLRAYAPSVPTETLSRLTRAFSHLRQLVDEGHLSYPYSSREAIAIARHLERFPGEPFEEALRNVFAFDVWSDSTVRESIVAAFKRSGFRVSNTFMQPPVELFEYDHCVCVCVCVMCVCGVCVCCVCVGWCVCGGVCAYSYIKVMVI
jgi:hypothetical protein